MKKTYKISLHLLVVIGVVHSALTPLFYDTLNIDALWFFGSGLCYVFMGLYNLAAIKVKIKSIFNIAIALNFIATIFTIAITYILKEPQAYIALVLVIFIFFNSLFIRN